MQPPVSSRSTLSRLKIGFAAYRCLAGLCLSSSRMTSITPSHGPIYGRVIGCCRWWPGGTAYCSVSGLAQQPKLPGYRSLAPTLYTKHGPDTRVKFQLEHPLVSNEPATKATAHKTKDPVLAYLYSAAALAPECADIV